MPRTPRPVPTPRRRLLRATATVVGMGGAAFAWFTLVPPDPTPVAAPSRDASPTEVVATYLRALDSHDCARVRTLWADTEVADAQERSCHNVAHVDNVRIGRPFRDPGSPGTAGVGQMVGVPVQFDLRWRLFHGDSTLTGPSQWGYQLIRSSAGGPWRLVGEGVG